MHESVSKGSNFLIVTDTNQKKNSCNYRSQLPFVLLLLLFVLVASGIAIFLKEGIAPDEIAHFYFSKHFSTTLSLPKDNAETIAFGWHIKHNPFLYHWITGRIIQVAYMLRPTISDRVLLVILRLFSVGLATGSLCFLHITSKRLIHKRWAQLIPPFLLANTLMFAFISSAVSYDNLAILFSFAAIYFFVKVFQGEKLVKNSLWMLLMLGLACLTKVSALPLACILGIWWLGFLIKNKVPIKKDSLKKSVVIFIAIILVFTLNIIIYGYNLVKFRSAIPSCPDLFSQQQCETSEFSDRYKMFALDKKMSVSESIEKGYPDPVEYAFYSWTPNMLYRTYGILAHSSYFPKHNITFFYILYIVYLIYAFRIIPKNPNIVFITLLSLVLGYIFVLFLRDYNSELVYGFKQIGMHGRYMFSSIGAFYILLAKVLEKGAKSIVAKLICVTTVILFLYSGPLSIAIYYSSFFKNWFF